MTTEQVSDNELRDRVRVRYAAAATRVLQTGAGVSRGDEW